MNNEVENLGGSTIETPKNEEPKKGCWRRLLELAESCLSHDDKDKWLDQMRGNIGLMATVIATMTFQMALNPPGGIRSIRDDLHPPGPKIAGPGDIDCGKFGINTYWDLCPGEAVIGASFPGVYFQFLVTNTICFVASLSVCLLLVSGIRLNHRFPMWVLLIGMCITLTTLAMSYIIALEMTAPGDVFNKADNFLIKLVYTWYGLLLIIGLWHTIRLVIWGVKHYRKRSKKVMTQKTKKETPVC